MTADTAIPVKPQKGIPKTKGGVSEIITMAEPMIIAAMIIEKEIRLPILLLDDWMVSKLF